MSSHRQRYKDLSVVVQGPLFDLPSAFRTIQSVRRHLPDSEIVLSTWAPQSDDTSFAERIELLDYDQIVLSEDPGAWLHNPYGVRSNLHRMLMSTRRGVEAAANDRVLKLRTDTELVGTEFLSGAERFRQRSAELSVLDEKVTIPSAFTRSSFPRARTRGAGRYPAILHISDWAAYGLRSDLLRLYGVEPPAEPGYSTFMVPLWSQLPSDAPFRYLANFQFPPEMYIGLKAVGEKVGISMRHWLDQPGHWERVGSEALASNFVVLNTYDDFGIFNSKYPTVSRKPWRLLDAANSLVTTHEYSRIYSRTFGSPSLTRPDLAEYLSKAHVSVSPAFSYVPARLRRSGKLRRLMLGEFA